MSSSGHSKEKHVFVFFLVKKGKSKLIFLFAYLFIWTKPLGRVNQNSSTISGYHAMNSSSVPLNLYLYTNEGPL